MRIIIHNNSTLGISKKQLLEWSEYEGKNTEIIHSGRNQVKLIKGFQYAITIKRFSNKLKNKCIYAFRKSKARKSYENAVILLSRGIDTPDPYGYIEKRGILNILLNSEYYCKYEERLTLYEAILIYGRECLDAFAEFVARLHQNGIRHDDLNNSNVRVSVDDNRNFIFSLIDLNRMKIYPLDHVVPEKECFENICRFSSLDNDYIFFVMKYIEVRNMKHAKFSDALAAKNYHDWKIDAKKWFKQLISLQKI